ncbi:hypothetical protein BA895_20015 [Humibacillus sp. DSM 29435]|nr:hypothetical protein BA895_20015 [Humibacillus sp. DSM 29435]
MVALFAAEEKNPAIVLKGSVNLLAVTAASAALTGKQIGLSRSIPSQAVSAHLDARIVDDRDESPRGAGRRALEVQGYGA